MKLHASFRLVWLFAHDSLIRHRAAPLRSSRLGRGTVGIFHSALGALFLLSIGMGPRAFAQSPVGVVPRSFEGTGLLTEEIDGEGNVSLHRFDAAGSLDSVSLPEGLSRAFQSSQAGALPPAGAATSADHPVSIGASGMQASGNYLEFGGANTRAMSFVLGSGGQVTEWKEGNITTSFTRDANGLVTERRSPNGHEFTMSYDEHGDLLRQTDELLGATLSIQYDPVHGQVTAITLPESPDKPIVMAYDGRGNLTRLTSPEGRTENTLFNARSQIASHTSSRGLVTTFVYDENHDLEEIREGTGADERVSLLEVDDAGRLVLIASSEGPFVRREYFPSGGVRSITESGMATVHFIEDNNLNLLEARLPGGAIHEFTYDGLQRLKSYKSPGKPALVYDYNVHSEETSLTIDGTRWVAIEYNGRRQVTTMNFVVPAEAPLGVANEYDDVTTGNPVKGSSTDGIDLAPTFLGDLLIGLTWSGAIQGAYEVTLDGNRRAIADRINGGNEILFSFDDDDLMLSAGALLFTRDPGDGLVSKMTLGVVSEEFEYNIFQEPVVHRVLVNNQILIETSYVRNNLGQIVTRTETLRGVTTDFQYVYDAAGQLETVRTDGVATESYAYDSRRNILQDHVHGAYVSDLSDRLTVAGAITMTHDDRGSLLTKSRAGETTRFFYTAGYKLRRVELPDGRVVTFRHDPFLNRTIKEIDGVVVEKFLCMTANLPVAKLDAANGLISRYVYGERRNMPEYFIENDIAYRIVADHVGSARFVIDTGTGEVVQEISYDAFGRILADTNPGFQPFGFAGGRYDPDVKTVRFGARDYDPEMRRWTSPDPLLFVDGHYSLYTYTRNDPVNKVDPTGAEPANPFKGLSQQDQLIMFMKLFRDKYGDHVADELERRLANKLSVANSTFTGLLGKQFSAFPVVQLSRVSAGVLQRGYFEGNFETNPGNPYDPNTALSPYVDYLLFSWSKGKPEWDYTPLGDALGKPSHNNTAAEERHEKNHPGTALPRSAGDVLNDFTERVFGL